MSKSLNHKLSLNTNTNTKTNTKSQSLDRPSLSIIAPSFKIPTAELNECLEGLSRLNFNFKIKEPLFDDLELCSNNSVKRLGDFKSALKAKSEFIWCLRGGYGALHIAPEILNLKKPKVEKKLIGFSDITILHYIINQHWNWPSLHWKHLNGFLDSETKKFDKKLFAESVDRLNHDPFFYFEGLKPINPKAEKIKSLKTKVIGGNLITLQSLIGLKIKKPKNKILFLEEIDEPVYKIDRALTQLEYAGWFSSLKGIILGSFTNKNSDIEKQINNYFKTKFLKYNFPVYKGLKAGHISDQKPLFLNTDSELINKDGIFKLKNKNGFLKGKVL